MTWWKSKPKKDEGPRVREGERWLYRKNPHEFGPDIDDMIILEVSPDGQYFRRTGRGWVDVDRITLLAKLDIHASEEKDGSIPKRIDG